MTFPKLMPFQKEGCKLIDKFKGRALLADDMGLGKTIQSAAWGVRRKKFPTIVVCPAAVKYHWQKEYQKHFGKDAVVLEGRTPPKNYKQLFTAEILIINYEILSYWLRVLLKYEAQYIIIDECQRIRNIKTQTSRSVRRLCKGKRTRKGKKIKYRRCPHVVGLSGTPIENYPIEIWAILNILHPKKYRNQMQFGMKNCKMKVTPWKMDFREAKNPTKLRRELTATCMIRRKKKDVLKELPKKRRTVLPIVLNTKQRKEYLNAKNDFINWLRKKSPARAERAKKSMKLTRAGYLKRLTAELKLRWVTDWIDNYLETTDKKLVVMGIHSAVLQPLREKYREQSAIVTGKIKGRKRQAAIERFRKSKKCRLFIGNLAACGTGVDGLQIADTMLVVECPWSPGLLLQLEDRIHRIGQVWPSMIYYPIVQNTIEEALFRVLQSKQKGINQSLDSDSVKAVELDIWSLVQQELNKMENENAV